MRDKNILNEGYDPNLGSFEPTPPDPSPGASAPAPPDPGRQPINAGIGPDGALSPPPPPAPFTECQICSAKPSATFEFTNQTGAIFVVSRDPVGGHFCRDCGLAAGRAAQNGSLMKGWFGTIAFVTNFYTVSKNALNLRRANALEAPVGSNGRTRDPGRPTLLRVGGLVGATAATLVVGFLSFAFIDSFFLNPTEAATRLEAGDCLDNPDEESFNYVPSKSCDEPHDLEVIGVVELNGGVINEDLVFEDCFAEFESYVAPAVWDMEVIVTFFLPDTNIATSDDQATCLLEMIDGSKMTRSWRADA